MPAALQIQNNFTGGLKTEFTGLNFPENAATDCDNVIFDIVGDVYRREGIDYETNYQLNTITGSSGKAMSTFKWKNVAGDGSLEFLVQQIGGTLYFYKTSAATDSNPISKQKITSTVDITQFLVQGSSNDPTIVECEYTSGNGFLFVTNPYCEPFYLRYVTLDGTFIATPIIIKTRDFKGATEAGVDPSLRPLTLSSAHLYNLLNQGWTQGAIWNNSLSITVTGAVNGTSPAYNILHPALGTFSFTVASGLSVVVGQNVIGHRNIGFKPAGIGSWYSLNDSAFSGIVTAYSGTTLTIAISTVGSQWTGNGTDLVNHGCFIFPTSTGYIDGWKTAIGTYPSNSDVWWRYKDGTNTFNPASTVNQVTANAGQAPNGRYILSEFDQQRAGVSGVTDWPDISTNIRPRTCAWFAGRIWYTGVDDSFVVNDDVFGTVSYNWSENLYFSKTAQSEDDLARCYQTNDPTAEDFFDLLPTDGGVVAIVGCGRIFKLFPIQNGMLAFCQNGIWFITGSQGIGFTANDYTVTKLSSIKSISSHSVVDVNGLPTFWNEEGIYSVQPTQNGSGLSVEPITVSTILSFYSTIPLTSKLYARGDYDPINYTIQWIYKGTGETSISDRYQFDKILCLNTYNKAFFKHSIEGTPFVRSINYVDYPGSATAPDPTFKYMCSTSNSFTFAQENDEDYKDFQSYDGNGEDYVSYFVTGFRLGGQAFRKFQSIYLYMFSRAEEPTQYKIQSIWDYATSPDSGRYSSNQLITNDKPDYGMIFRRHKLRGQGLVAQYKVTSVSGQPFDIMGWTVPESSNTGV